MRNLQVGGLDELDEITKEELNVHVRRRLQNAGHQSVRVIEQVERLHSEKASVDQRLGDGLPRRQARARIEEGEVGQEGLDLDFPRVRRIENSMELLLRRKARLPFQWRRSLARSPTATLSRRRGASASLLLRLLLLPTARRRRGRSGSLLSGRSLLRNLGVKLSNSSSTGPCRQRSGGFRDSQRRLPNSGGSSDLSFLDVVREVVQNRRAAWP